jgi:hypothetical protein
MYIFHGVGVCNYVISKKVSQFFRGNDDHADVDPTCDNFVVQVLQINEETVAPRGD